MTIKLTATQDLLVQIIRNDFSIDSRALLEKLSMRDWKELFALATAGKIFPLFYQFSESMLPQETRATFDTLYQNHIQRAHIQLDALDKISSTFAEERLRFILFKGLSLSKLLYNDFTTRQSGDIDILVDSADLIRADYALRNRGFFQTEWASDTIVATREVAQFLRVKYEQGSPYAYKRKTHDNQLAPYYSTEAHQKVEIHDGIQHLASDYVKQMLWMSTAIDVGDTSVRIFDLERTMLCLLITAYENSETYYACKDGELNLRDYIDIHRFIVMHKHQIDWEKLARVTRQQEICEIAAVTYSNYKDIYGEENDVLCTLANDIKRPSIYASNFLLRLFDPEYCKSLAKLCFQQSCRDLAANHFGFKLHEGMPVVWGNYVNPFKLDVKYGIGYVDEAIEVSWCIPQHMYQDIALFGFQMALYPGFNSEHLGYLIRLLHESDGSPSASLRVVERPVQQFLGTETKGALEHRTYVKENYIYETIIVPLAKLSFTQEDLRVGVGIAPMVFSFATRSHYNSICASENEFMFPRQAFYM